jgi:hypothetical protein
LRSGRFQRSRCHPISRRPARDPLPAGRGGCEHRTLQKALPSKNGRRKILPLACRNWPRDLLGSGWSGVPARSPFFENSPLVLSCPRSAWSRTDRRSAARPRSRTDRCSEFSPRLRRGVAQRRTTPTGMVTDPPAEPGAAGGATAARPTHALTIAPRKSSASDQIRDAFLKNANKNEAPQLADLADMAVSQKPGFFRRSILPTCKNPAKMRDDHGTADRRNGPSLIVCHALHPRRVSPVEPMP